MRESGKRAGAGRRLAAALTALIALAGASQTRAETARAETARDWPAEPFAYVVIRQDLRGVLEAFAGWAGLHLALDDDAAGVVTGPLPPLAPEALLDRLAAERGLYWWIDGDVLHVGPADGIATASIPIAPTRRDAAARALRRLGLADGRYHAQMDSDLGAVAATGPKPFVAKVRAVLESDGAAGGLHPVAVLRGGRMATVLAPVRPDEAATLSAADALR